MACMQSAAPTTQKTQSLTPGDDTTKDVTALRLIQRATAHLLRISDLAVDPRLDLGLAEMLHRVVLVFLHDGTLAVLALFVAEGRDIVEHVIETDDFCGVLGERDGWGFCFVGVADRRGAVW